MGELIGSSSGLLLTTDQSLLTLCLLKKIKVCITSMKCCLFCKNREEKIDLEASRYGFRPMSDAGSNDVVDGLAGRIRKRDRSR